MKLKKEEEKMYLIYGLNPCISNVNVVPLLYSSIKYEISILYDSCMSYILQYILINNNQICLLNMINSLYHYGLLDQLTNIFELYQSILIKMKMKMKIIIIMIMITIVLVIILILIFLKI